VRTWGGLGLIYLAGAADGQPWDVDWYDPILGFVVLPVIMVAVRAWHPPLRIATDSPHRTARDRAQSHRDSGARLNCTVVSNLVLRRDDQIGCPTLFLIDDAEARMRRADTTAAR